MSIRTSLELRGKVRAVHLNLKVIDMEVVFKTLGTGRVHLENETENRREQRTEH